MAGHMVSDPNVALAPGAITDVNLIQYLGVACGPLNPVDVDPVDRAARLLGIIYGENAQVQQLTPADDMGPNESLEVTSFLAVYDALAGDWNRVREGSVVGSVITEDTGVNTNPERWLHENHWNPAAEIIIAVAGAPGEQNLGAAVGAGVTRRIREVSIRHAGTNNTVVSILDVTGGNILVSIDVPALSMRTWSSQDGRLVAATLQPVVQTSDITGGSTFVSAAGVEA